MSNERELIQLLNSCVALIDTDTNIGTGFFVAPGKILTCAHVVRGAVGSKQSIRVIYGGKKYVAKPVGPKEIFLADNEDLALLRIRLKDHPCVLLGVEDNLSTVDLHSYGFTMVKDDNSGQRTVGEEFKATLEGKREEFKSDLTLIPTLIKFREGQVKPGYSGAPLLDVGAGLVTGVVSLTREESLDLGGYAIPTGTVWSLFPLLKKQNRKFHRDEKIWTQLMQGIRASQLFKPIFVHQYEKPDEIPHREYIIEREDILGQIEGSLFHSSPRVLLNGIAGIGKTTLAYEIVDRHIRAGGGPVLWVEAGNADVDRVVESIAGYYEDQNLLSREKELKSRLQAVRELLEVKRISLLVVDNIVGRDAWLNFVDAIPKNLPVLVTSRSRFAIGDFVDVDPLPPDQALNLLEEIVQDKTISADSDAAFLCKLFGYHPLAIQIMGANMKEVPLTPKEQRQRLELNPTKLSSALYEDKLWALIDESTTGLDEFERTVFLAFGSFPINGLTLHLLASYLHKTTDELQTALDRLLVRNLIEKRSGVDYYFLHDTIFYHIKTMVKPPEKSKPRLIKIALNYLKKNRYAYDLIRLDIENLLAIAKFAQQINLVQFISYLVIDNYHLLDDEEEDYANKRGYSKDLIEQLDRALEVVGRMGGELNSTRHHLLSKRGNVAFKHGEYPFAVDLYVKALSNAPNDGRKVVVGSVLARSLAFCDRFEESREHFRKAHQLVSVMNDLDLRVFVLEQESWVAGYLKDFERVRQLASEQLEITEFRYKKDPNPDADRVGGYFFALSNLGTAELDLAKQKRGDFNDAVKIHEKAHQLAEQQGNTLFQAFAITNLAEDYHYLGNKKLAEKSFFQAYQLWRVLGNKPNKDYVRELMQELGYSTEGLPKEEQNEHDV